MAKKGRPEPIGDILAQLLAKRGYARVQSQSLLETAWQEAAGSFVAQHTRVGSLKRGSLEVLVANSTLVQELGFQKQAILAKLHQLLPDQPITNLRFKVGKLPT